MTEHVDQLEPIGRTGFSNFALWFGLLAGATAWAIHLEAEFVLAPWYCERHAIWPLHLVTLLLLALTFMAGMTSIAQWRKSPRTHEYLEGRADRARFMAVLGALLNVLFFLLIFAEWIPVLVVDPCLR
jgi:hypothetical protein